MRTYYLTLTLRSGKTEEVEFEGCSKQELFDYLVRHYGLTMISYVINETKWSD